MIIKFNEKASKLVALTTDFFTTLRDGSFHLANICMYMHTCICICDDTPYAGLVVGKWVTV